MKTLPFLKFLLKPLYLAALMAALAPLRAGGVATTSAAGGNSSGGTLTSGGTGGYSSSSTGVTTVTVYRYSNVRITQCSNPRCTEIRADREELTLYKSGGLVPQQFIGNEFYTNDLSPSAKALFPQAKAFITWAEGKYIVRESSRPSWLASLSKQWRPYFISSGEYFSQVIPTASGTGPVPQPPAPSSGNSQPAPPTSPSYLKNVVIPFGQPGPNGVVVYPGASIAPLSFEWISNSQPDLGKRVWQQQGVEWTERTSSGRVKTFVIFTRGHLLLNGKNVIGTLVVNKNDTREQVFIPDATQLAAGLWTRYEGGAWTQIAPFLSPVTPPSATSRSPAVTTGPTVTTVTTVSSPDPTSFEWTYAAQPDPGIRTWQRNGNVWTEKSPKGTIKTFDVTGTLSVTANGIQAWGSIVRNRANRAEELFVPQSKYVSIGLWYRYGNGQWTRLAATLTLKSAPVAASNPPQVTLGTQVTTNARGQNATTTTTVTTSAGGVPSTATKTASTTQTVVVTPVTTSGVAVYGAPASKSTSSSSNATPATQGKATALPAQAATPTTRRGNATPMGGSNDAVSNGLVAFVIYKDGVPTQVELTNANKSTNVSFTMDYDLGGMIVPDYSLIPGETRRISIPSDLAQRYKDNAWAEFAFSYRTYAIQTGGSTTTQATGGITVK